MMDEREEIVKKILNEPVTCEDGQLHYLDEGNKRYLVSKICQLFETGDNPNGYGAKPDAIDIQSITATLCTCGHKMLHHYFATGGCERCDCKAFKPKPLRKDRELNDNLPRV